MAGLWRCGGVASAGVLTEISGDAGGANLLGLHGMPFSTASPMSCLTRRVEGASISNENGPAMNTPRRRLSLTSAFVGTPSPMSPVVHRPTTTLATASCAEIRHEESTTPETTPDLHRTRGLLEDESPSSTPYGPTGNAARNLEAHSPARSFSRAIRRTISSPAAPHMPLVRASSGNKRQNTGAVHRLCALRRDSTDESESSKNADSMDDDFDPNDSPKRKRSSSITGSDPLARSWPCSGQWHEAMNARPQATAVRRRACDIPVPGALLEEGAAVLERGSSGPLRRHTSWTGVSFPSRPTPLGVFEPVDDLPECEETDTAAEAVSLLPPPANQIDLYDRGDGERCQLPIVTGKHPDLKSITPETLLAMCSGAYKDRFEKVFVVDCRFGYEFEGGHIRDALNLWTREQVEERFLRRPIVEHRVAIVFHCEFSSSRGPKLLRYLRREDRRIHSEKGIYPNLYYPELYILYGGYKSFFGQFPSECEPHAYIPMKTKEYKCQMQRQIRISKNSRSKPMPEALVKHD